MRAKQIAEWRERYARQLLSIDFKPVADAPFRVSFAPIAEGIRVLRSSFSAGTTFRDTELLRDGDERLSLIVSHSPVMDVAVGGEALRVGKGEATLMPHWAVASVGSESGFVATSFTIPRSELARRTNPEKGVLTRVARNSPALRLLRAYCESIRTGPLLQSREMQEVTQRHIYDLTALAISGASLESGERAVGAARLANAEAYIAEHFRDPALNLAAVAKAQEISPRYLQKLFETAGISFTARINELRLELARNLLTDRSAPPRRISDIALLSGFSDVSHFNRLFRARFGDTPGSFSGKVN